MSGRVSLEDIRRNVEYDLNDMYASIDENGENDSPFQYSRTVISRAFRETIRMGGVYTPLVTESRLINCLNHESRILKYPNHKSREIMIFTDHSNIKLQQNIGTHSCV